MLFVDVSGGESSSMLVAMRDCIKASNVLSLNKSDGYTPLTFKEAFFLATLGGCQGKLPPPPGSREYLPHVWALLTHLEMFK